MTQEDKNAIVGALTSLVEAEEMVRRYEQRASEARAWLIQQLEDRVGRGKKYGVKEKFAMPHGSKWMVVSVQKGHVEDKGGAEWSWSSEVVN